MEGVDQGRQRLRDKERAQVITVEGDLGRSKGHGGRHIP